MPTYLADVVRASRDGSSLRFDLDGARVELTACTPRIVRVRLRLDGAPDGGPSYVGPREWPGAAVEVDDAEPLHLRTESLAVQAARRPFRLAFQDARGEVLVREPAEGGMAHAGLGVSVRLEYLGQQHFYGLGQGGQQFDRLGGVRQLWNSHAGHGPGSDIGVPLLVSNRGYGLFFDDTADATLAVGRSDGGFRVVYQAESGPLDWYVVVAPDVRALMGEVAELLGHAPMPPRWALGYLQSTRHFDDVAELRQLPRSLRARRIPCDALIFLSTYGDALGWNVGVGHLEFQPELWSHPAELVGEMRQQGFEVITHEYPVLHEKAPLFEEAEQLGYLLAEGYPRAAPGPRPTTDFQQGQRYLDFSSPEARAWWWAQHRHLVDLGVAGWWLDGGEGPPATAHLRGGDGVQLHNLYDRLRQQGFAEGEAADRPEQRPVLLCRSGAAGMQRYGAGCWSGDINNTFATFEYQLPWGLNTGMSGVPYWGTDIGGFFHPIPESSELFARWFQFGAFCPLFRAHGWVWREHLPWSHGEEVEAICRRYAELRYRLLPYTYTLARQAHAFGLPLMRPLVLNYPHDPRVWELGSQYLWGDDLLVAPVTREAARSWPVYLPAGAWHDFWTHERHEGPRGVAVDAPLDRLPLFVRGGAIIPLGPAVQHSSERLLEEVTLLVYPERYPIGDRSGSRFELYEDDGRTNAYRQGVFATTTFECQAERGRVMLYIGEPVGDRSIVPSTRTYTVQLRGDRPRRVRFDDRDLSASSAPGQPDPGWWHDGAFTLVRLPRAAGALLLE